MVLPKLRSNLDIFPVQYEGKTCFCVKDMEGYLEDVLLFTPETLVIASFFDGRNDYDEIKTFFAKNFGGLIISEEYINEVIKILDEKLLLENERFYKAKEKIVGEFISSPTRRPYLAGKSYPENSEELRTLLYRAFISENGPGAIEKDNMIIKNIKGFISPHIDFGRGAYCYAYAYKELAESIKPKSAIIFGVAHASPPYPYVLLDKNFETPLGILKFDHSFKKYLSDELYKKLIKHQFTHKIEHSIEFQTVWLKYVLGEQDINIVPVLCSIIPDENTTDEAEEFIQACRKYITDNSGDVIVIAGADLSHIGPRFGDNIEITDKLISWIKEEDLGSLEFCENIDANGFMQFTLTNNDLRKVCGLTSVYTTLRVLEGNARQGKLLKYAYAPDPVGGIVSFCSMVFT